mmetsp:Transcript_25809/g.45493  ORF Transcript_25809/g.45493 Transcript_25809/m.45493 type:complete len:273 (+) Transcript_25809:854-1672(+)
MTVFEVLQELVLLLLCMPSFLYEAACHLSYHTTTTFRSGTKSTISHPAQSLTADVPLQFLTRFLVHELRQNVRPSSGPISQIVRHGGCQNGSDTLEFLGGFVFLLPLFDLFNVLDFSFGTVFLGILHGALQGRDGISGNGQDLHLEHQNVSALDFGRTAVVPVCQFAWNVQFPLVTSNHQLHRFRPSFNHLVGSERSGLTTFVTRVEYGPVNESPLVVTRTGRIDSGVSGSFSFRQDLVLKTGRKRNNTWFLFVLFQKGQPSLVGAGRHEQQ